ncbi:secretory protein of YscJ/FliF family [Alteromonas sp. 76-1]|nr:secretory protein of YscJ/FliF family [Alteromonas sp. 76-1]
MVISVTVAIFVLIWARTDSPIYRPLIQDMRLVDSVEIVDVLDQEGIRYYSDVKNHMLYVDQAKSDLARVALAKKGFVIEYPEITKHSDLNTAYDEFIKQQEEKELNGQIWEQPTFLPLVKLVMGALVIIVLILAVVRPMLRQFLLDEEDE